MSKDTLQQKLLKILLIGDSCIDKYHYGSVERYSQEERPPRNVPIFNNSRTVEKFGMAYNVYENLKSVGFNVDFLTNKEIITKERYMIQDDSNSFVQLIRADFENNVKNIDIDLLKNIEYDKYACIIFSDYEKGFITHKAVSEVVKKFKGPIIVDSKKRDLSCFENCIIKINKYEESQIEKMPNICDLIVTTGKDGAIWNNKVFNAAHSSNIVDICGAGDVFLTGLSYHYIHNRSIEESIKFANKCASLSLSTIGNYILKKEDILNFYK